MSEGGFRLLVIDDEDSIRFAMKEYFEVHGYRVDCAREAEEAEALLAHLRYDVVIADLQLSGILRLEGSASSARSDNGIRGRARFC